MSIMPLVIIDHPIRPTAAMAMSAKSKPKPSSSPRTLSDAVHFMGFPFREREGVGQITD